MTVHLTWIQPLCDACWAARADGRTPVRDKSLDSAQCASCGTQTDSQIVDQINPVTLQYPRLVED